MNDDELIRRLSETLRAKGGQVPEPSGAFDGTVRAAFSAADPHPGRRGWTVALVAAAVIAVIAIAAGAVALTGSDDDSPAAVPGTTTTTDVTPTTSTSTTSSSSTSTTSATQPRTTTSVSPVTTPPRAVGWSVPPNNADGTIPVAGFNAYLDKNSPSWASSKEQVVIEFLRLDLNPAQPANKPPQIVPIDAGPDGGFEVTEYLADDSVRTVTSTILLRKQANGTWRLESATWTQRCQPGRGHQNPSTDLCV